MILIQDSIFEIVHTEVNLSPKRPFLAISTAFCSRIKVLFWKDSKFYQGGLYKLDDLKLKFMTWSTFY